MANLKISQLPSVVIPTINDYMVVVNDGVTKKMTIDDLKGIISFTGNTSGDCISDIYVSNIHSCSPLNLFSEGFLLATLTVADGLKMEDNVSLKLGSGSTIVNATGTPIVKENGSTEQRKSGIYGDGLVSDGFIGDSLTFRKVYTGSTTGGTVFSVLTMENPGKLDLYSTERNYVFGTLVGTYHDYRINESFNTNINDSLVYSRTISGSSSGVTGTTKFAEKYDLFSGLKSESFNNGLVDYRIAIGPSIVDNGLVDYRYNFDESGLGTVFAEKYDFIGNSRITNVGPLWCINEKGEEVPCPDTASYTYSIREQFNSDVSDLVYSKTISGSSTGVTGTTKFAEKYDLVSGLKSESFNNGLVDYRIANLISDNAELYGSGLVDYRYDSKNNNTIFSEIHDFENSIIETRVGPLWCINEKGEEVPCPKETSYADYRIQEYFNTLNDNNLIYSKSISGSSTGLTATTKHVINYQLGEGISSERIYNITDAGEKLTIQKSVGYNKNNLIGLFPTISGGLDSLNRGGTTCFCAGKPKAWGVACIQCKDDSEYTQKAAINLNSYVNDAQNSALYIVDSTLVDDYVTAKSYFHSDFTSQLVDQYIFNSSYLEQTTRAFNLDYNIDSRRFYETDNLVLKDIYSGSTTATTATTVFETAYDLINGNLITKVNGNETLIIGENAIKYVDGNQLAGYVLTSDANGNATWQAASVGTDTFITGMTFNNGTYDLTISRNDNTSFTQSLSVLATDMVVTGGTYNINTGIVTFTNNSGGTFQVTGFTSGMTDSYTTTATTSGTIISFDNNVQGSGFYSVDLAPMFDANALWTASTGTDAVVLANSGSIASGITAVAEGTNTTASGDYSHAEGWDTIASGTASHAEGYLTIANNYAHAEGLETVASGVSSHAEGRSSTASGFVSHAEGQSTTASGDFSHAEGQTTIASGTNSHAEGNATVASGNTSHAEGYQTTAIGYSAHAEGDSTIASGDTSHAEGNATQANGTNSHSEGSFTIANGTNSHAEGGSTQANGVDSHAGGNNSIANGNTSFVHSTNSVVTGDRSAVLGGQNITGSSNDTVYVPNLDSIGVVKTGGVQVGTNVDSNGVTYSVTENDYYLRSKAITGNTIYNLSSTPPDGQQIVVHKNGNSINYVRIHSPVSGGITACGDNSIYNVLDLKGTNNTVTLIYDGELNSWVVVSTCGDGADFVYAATI